jgi:hypothetical protein
MRITVDQDKVLWREIADQIVVLHLPTSRFVELNHSGATLWERVVDGATAEDLEQVLRERYEVSADTAAEDVRKFLADLSAADLLQIDE